MAFIVDDEARKGDQVALSILEQAADAISETVRDVVHRLEMLEDDYAMIGIGGVISSSAIYWRRVCGRVAEFAPNLKPVLPEAPQVVGLALIALDRTGAADPESLRRNLFRSFKEKGRSNG